VGDGYVSTAAAADGGNMRPKGRRRRQIERCGHQLTCEACVREIGRRGPQREVRKKFMIFGGLGFSVANENNPLVSAVLEGRRK
jgi:hypothetical protein